MPVRYAPALTAAPVALRLAAGASFAQGGAATVPAAPRRGDPAALQTLAGETMGTTWSVRLANPAFQPLAPVRAAIEDALARVVAQMSHWAPGSELSRFNRAAPGSRHVLSPEFFQVLQAACHWAQASGGAWDPTIGPLVDAWGFGPHGTPHLPTDGHLAQARAQVGFGRLALDAGRRTALQPGGLRLDLSGIAKGFAVDLVVQRLQSLGFTDTLVEVGGELRASGQRPNGTPWRVAVAEPAQSPASAPRALALRGAAIATSGDRWHAFEQGGRRYPHTLDPRTGEPVQHALASVTVLHAECMHADALATVITVLGPADGLVFAQQHGLAVLLGERTPHGMAWASTPAFDALVA